ncbi:uncharacterized protein K460DRAFT_3966 [Cucurbitaria berberidis CBS 394.84]|uniref:Uncharacterized protein n=1 Tax=Cucurbitaria berberidis CBS 394.84 TaxID=1168544 RepID=A0A9P4GR10_9PLEO|nr:uncharacterized protein K460DRAFT_3966 [Cucurbitaria berberidis CBS 394.84]KAF1849796.1 hypothetical protein K460DRAFT_3966 [Cucurbitaria berberidis CBS 394.84]
MLKLIDHPSDSLQNSPYSQSHLYSESSYASTTHFRTSQRITTTRTSIFFSPSQVGTTSISPTHSPINQATSSSNSPRTGTMCIVLFATAASCSCPPTPTYPYLRLCPAARQHDPIKACPVGSRISQTLGYAGACLWCRQVGREKARNERREWAKGRLMDSARDSSSVGEDGSGGGKGFVRGYGSGRFVRW